MTHSARILPQGLFSCTECLTGRPRIRLDGMERKNSVIWFGLEDKVVAALVTDLGRLGLSSSLHGYKS
jgi:hypothetical protein